MTRERAEELLPIIEAFINGEDVQYFNKPSSEWLDTTNPAFRDNVQYRIKPEPKQPREYWINPTNMSVLTENDLECGSFEINDLIHVKEVTD